MAFVNLDQQVSTEPLVRKSNEIRLCLKSLLQPILELRPIEQSQLVRIAQIVCLSDSGAPLIERMAILELGGKFPLLSFVKFHLHDLERIVLRIMSGADIDDLARAKVEGREDHSLPYLVGPPGAVGSPLRQCMLDEGFFLPSLVQHQSLAQLLR
jgi:hypothetical protein